MEFALGFVMEFVVEFFWDVFLRLPGAVVVYIWKRGKVRFSDLLAREGFSDTSTVIGVIFWATVIFVAILVKNQFS